MGLARVAALAGAALLATASPAAASYTVTLQGTQLLVAGDGASELVTVYTDGTNLFVDVGLDGAVEATVARNTFDSVAISAGDGDDEVSVGSGLSSENLSIDAGAGADLVFGGDGTGPIAGGPGPDEITGGPGAESITGGDGDDLFRWNPGDGNDTIDAGAGSDALAFDAAAAAEVMALTAVAGVARLTRNVGAVTMNLTSMEEIEVRMAGGADTFTGGAGLAALVQTVRVDGGPGVDALTGGDSRDVLVTGATAGDQANGGGGADLVIGGADGDSLAGGGGDDRFPLALPAFGADSIDGGPGTGDTLDVTASEGPDRIFLSGTPAAFTLGDSDEDLDQAVTTVEALRIGLGSGTDTLDAAGGTSGPLRIDADGGPGADTFFGADGADVLRGGDGPDLISAQGGDDQLFGDAGTDRLFGGEGADSFACGAPGDLIVSDPGEQIAADCFPPAPPGPPPPEPPGPDETAPGAVLRGFAARIARRAFLRRGVTGTVVLDEPARIEALLVGRLKGTRIARPGDVILAERRLGLAAGRRTVRLRAPRKVARRLARRARLRIQVTAIDAAGNRTTRTRRVRIR